MPHKHTAFEICGWYYGRRLEWKPARELTIYTRTQADDRNLSLNSSGSPQCKHQFLHKFNSFFEWAFNPLVYRNPHANLYM